MIKQLEAAIFGAKTRQKLQIDALDGVRGLAVLFVLFSHAAGMDLVFFPEIKLAGSGSGQLGVYLFFALSAFLLTRGLIRQGVTAIKSARLWLDYFLRRLLRIYPLYTVFLITIWIGWQSGLIRSFGSFNLNDLWQHLTLQAGRHHTWTIGVEVRYYFVLPIFVWVFFFVIKKNIGLLTVLIMAIMLVAARYFPGLPAEYTNLKFLPLFLTGSYFAVLNEEYQKQPKRIPSVVLTLVGFVSLGIMLFYMPSTYELFMGEKHHLISVRFFPLWGMLFSLFIFAVINEQGILTRLFSHRAVRFLGIVSFSMYLWHYLALHWALKLAAPLTVKIVAYYVGSLLFSTLSFLAFEKPLSGVRLKRPTPVTQTAAQSASD